jgi:hypothetical protein
VSDLIFRSKTKLDENRENTKMERMSERCYPFAPPVVKLDVSR